MAYFVYILYSATPGRYYIGSCENIESRLKKHLANHKGFTAKAKDWRLVYDERFPEKTLALRRERQLKNWKNKRRIEQLIEKGRSSEHPD
jgi:putative endonuclease